MHWIGWEICKVFMFYCFVFLLCTCPKHSSGCLSSKGPRTWEWNIKYMMKRKWQMVRNCCISKGMWDYSAVFYTWLSNLMVTIDQFGFKSMASAIPGGLPRQTKDDAMPQAYTCSWTKAVHSLKYSSFVMLLEAPQIWRMKRYNVLETELVYTAGCHTGHLAAAEVSHWCVTIRWIHNS